jgi:hypothetical protein
VKQEGRHDKNIFQPRLASKERTRTWGTRLRVGPLMGRASVSASRMYLRRGRNNNHGERYDYFSGGRAKQTEEGSLVGLSFPSALERGRYSCSCGSFYFRRLIPFASSLDPNRNPVFSDTDSASVLHRTRSPALSSSLADGMDLGASVFDFVCFLHPDASTPSWSVRALFRLGLSARTSLLRPARGHTAFLCCSIIFLGRISTQDNSRA